MSTRAPHLSAEVEAACIVAAAQVWVCRHTGHHAATRDVVVAATPEVEIARLAHKIAAAYAHEDGHHPNHTFNHNHMMTHAVEA